MDARILFWAAALANMGAIVVLLVRGIRQVRAGDTDAHRRSMLTAGALVVGFLVAYLVKRAVLGGENLSVWGTPALVNLYVHETMVAAMLLTGLLAFVRGRRLAGTRRVTRNTEDPVAPPDLIAGHRRVGRIAVGAAVLGFVTACGILAGMIQRMA